MDLDLEIEELSEEIQKCKDEEIRITREVERLKNENSMKEEQLEQDLVKILKKKSFYFFIRKELVF